MYRITNTFFPLLPALAFVLLTAAAPDRLAAQAGTQSDRSEAIARIIERNGASNAFWSLTVRDSTGQVLEQYNMGKLIRPASNLKLLTAATVLDELGPDFTYKTHMYGLGRREGDTWNGNIIIRGAGDPSMSGTFYDDDRLHVMEQFYRMVRERGITRIDGNLVGNDSYFDAKAYPDGWSWDDLSFYYAVPVSALSFNNNTVDLTVYADGAVGETPRIEWFPFDTDYVTFINEQVITPPNAEYDEYYERLMGTNTILLRSSLPRGYVEKEALSVANPPLFFLDTFLKYLESGGIEVTGHPLIDSSEHGWDESAYEHFGTHESVPLRRLLQQLNKESDNFYAEMLLKTAAAEHYDTQGTTELGISLIEQFASSLGIDTGDISISDGSGMSPTNLLSTQAISKLLVGMRRHPHFEAFSNSLPMAGVDGSLEYRFRNTPLRGRLQAKTGYISGVRALSGYLKTKSDKTLIFSVATNHYTGRTSYIDSVQESILTYLYQHY